MHVYDAKGRPSNITSSDGHVPFSRLKKGDVFKQGGRILVKTSTIMLVDKHAGIDNNGGLKFKKFNAVRLTDQTGSKSCISDDTMVVPYPEAAVYLKG